MANRYLLLLLVCGFILAAVPRTNTEITFMDVGQGDGIYLNIPGQMNDSVRGRKKIFDIFARSNILIDSGSSSNKKLGEYVTVNFLKSKAVGKLEAVFVSHADTDHTNAIIYLLSESDIKVKTLYLPCLAEDDDNYDELRDAARASGTTVRYLMEGDVVEIKTGFMGTKINSKTKVRFTCVAPSPDDTTSDINDQSLVLVYDEGNFRALFMGDASKEVERRVTEKYAIKDVTLLKCGHHGSNTSTSEELLDEAKPHIAILSYGEGNRYGHPHQETLDLLEERGISLYHTAEGGAISVYTNGKKIKVDEFG